MPFGNVASIKKGMLTWAHAYQAGALDHQQSFELTFFQILLVGIGNSKKVDILIQ